MQQAAKHRPERRRTTAAALTQQVLAFLADGLPDGWISQSLPSQGKAGGAASAGGPGSAGDILIISPRGRCHFLFVRAPEDRGWDGGPRSVAAETFSEAEAQLAHQLRMAGHKARAIWGEKDLAQALRAWGCPVVRPVTFAPRRAGIVSLSARTKAAEPGRATLHLSAWRRSPHA